MNGRLRRRLLLSLIGLYPRRWQRRYSAEFTELVTALIDDRRRGSLSLAFDIALGALDAHLSRRHNMTSFSVDVSVRRGIYDGLIVSGVLAVLAFLANVVFPGGPNDSDSDPVNAIAITCAYLSIAVLLVVIGARAHRRANTPYAGAKAGAVAGFMIATLLIATFLIIDNLFFGIVSQQHDKVLAFAASGASSMRTFVNVSLLQGSAFFIPILTALGGVLGLLGGSGVRGTRDSVPGLTR